MSVIVKGMEMPECCYECPMVHRGFDGYETRLDCYMVKDWCPEDEGVHPDCPLVALPDHHGRLVDADALIKFIEDRYEITWESDCYEGGIKDACTDILEKIDAMPTIVEAEGET